MKKIILTMVLATHLVLPAEGLHFLISIPAVLEHYQHHREQHHDKENFLQFIAEHFTGNTTHHAEHPEDRESPMHHHESCFIQLVALNTRSENFHVFLNHTDCGVVLFKQPDHQSDYLASIWQPPKTSDRV